MQEPLAPVADQRLAAVCTDEGQIDRDAVERLLNTHPATLSVPQLEAMQVIVFENQRLAEGLTYTPPWMEAFVAVTGGWIETERTNHDASGSTTTRAVRHYRGRRDVRQYRAQASTIAPARVRSCSRAARPRERRASASSTTSGADPNGSEADQPGEPHLRLAPSRAVLTFGCLTAEQRGEQVTR